MKLSTVTFAELRQLLKDLGFQETAKDQFPRFEHPASGTVFHYRPYRPDDFVTAMDLARTSYQLNWRGLLPPEAFEDRLKKTPA